MLIPVISESGREHIPKKEENLKTGVHWNYITLGLYTSGCFGTYSGILLSQSNSNSLALARYLKKTLICADWKVLTNNLLGRWQAKFETKQYLKWTAGLDATPFHPNFSVFSSRDHIHQSAEPCTQMFGICEKQYVNIWIGEFFSTQRYGHNRVLEWKGKGCCSCHLLSTERKTNYLSLQET